MNQQISLLVVDDEEVVCRSCTRIFERQGFNVETCTNPREGLKLAQGKAYAAVLLDIMMPDLGGIEFLEQLRASNPNLPVIIITGYSSVSNAAEAMRLHAADYISKPFTPDEITDAVARVIPFPSLRHPPAELAKRESGWKGTHEFAFVDNAWAEPAEDRTSLRVGMFLASEDGKAVESLRVARVGDKVYRGLPLGEVTLHGFRRRAIPSPVTGVVVEVNQAMLDNPTAAWGDPCGKGWIARVVPEPSALESDAAEPRHVVLATDNDLWAQAHKARLAQFGCEVTTTRDSEGTLNALRAKPAALLLDADSFGLNGPAIVRAVRAAKPEVRTVVVAGAASQGMESAYRDERIFYYTLNPVADPEMIDILDSMFRAVPAPGPTATTRGVLPPGMSAVRIINRSGESVSLLAEGGVLQISRGLGQRIVQRILAGSFPIRVTLGAGPLGPKDIGRAADVSDRIVVLEVRDGGRIPGTLQREASSGLAQKAGEVGKKVATLMLQPASAEADPLGFDARTLDALAAVIVGELSGRR